MPASQSAFLGRLNSNDSFIAVYRLMAGRCYGDTFEEKVVQTFDLETRETPVGFVLQYSNLSSKLINVPWSPVKRPQIFFFLKGKNKIKRPLPVFTATQTNPRSKQNLPTDWKWLVHLHFFKLENAKKKERERMLPEFSHLACELWFS